MAGFVSKSAEMDLSWRDVDLAPDAERLPVHVELRPPRVPGLVSCLFALALGAPAVFSSFAPGSGLPVSLACLMLLCGLGCAAVGAHFLLLLVEWEFTPVAISCRQRGILGRREWQEPLSSYRCILARQVFRSGWPADPPDVLRIIELKHASRRARDVRLYCSNLKKGFRSRHAHYARLFELPAALATPSGEVTCPPAYLEAAGSEAIGDPAFGLAECLAESPPLGGIAVTSAAGMLAVKTRPNQSPWFSYALGVGFVVLVVWSDTLTLQDFLLWEAVLASLLVLFPFVWPRLATERIEVLAHTLRYRGAYPRRREAEMRLPRVQEARIAHEPGTLWWRKAVLITDGQQDIYFGASLSSAEKEWVCRCINAVLAAG